MPTFFKGLDNKYIAAGYFFLLLFQISFLNTWLSNQYLSSSIVQNIKATCPPYFQSCLDWYQLTALPYGYSLSTLYAFVGTLFFGAILFGLLEKWRISFLLALVGQLFILSVVFFLAYDTKGNYTILSSFAVLLLLFSKNKHLALKVLLSLMYLFSAAIKMYPTFLNGDFFRSMEIGLPLVPRVLDPYLGIMVVNVFIFIAVSIWLKSDHFRMGGYFVAIAFHIYTIILVGFNFPTLSLILVITCLLLDLEKFQNIQIILLKKEKALAVICSLLICLQIAPLLIEQDHRITGEGERYGLYIFNTNKQCRSIATAFYKDGTKKEMITISKSFIERCDPYLEWFQYKKLCEESERIEWQFLMSLNGGYFREVVSTDNLCTLPTYKPFEHNEWITDSKIRKDISIPRARL